MIYAPKVIFAYAQGQSLELKHNPFGAKFTPLLALKL
jgi:hypothetical protein